MNLVLWQEDEGHPIFALILDVGFPARGKIWPLFGADSLDKNRFQKGIWKQRVRKALHLNSAREKWWKNSPNQTLI